MIYYLQNKIIHNASEIHYTLDELPMNIISKIRNSTITKNVFSNLNKNGHCGQEEPTVNIDVRISSRTAFADENIKYVIDKIKNQTKEIPHVNIRLYIS